MIPIIVLFFILVLLELGKSELFSSVRKGFVVANFLKRASWWFSDEVVWGWASSAVQTIVKKESWIPRPSFPQKLIQFK